MRMVSDPVPAKEMFISFPFVLMNLYVYGFCKHEKYANHWSGYCRDRIIRDLIFYLIPLYS